MTGRANKIVATEYKEGDLHCVQMGNDTWSVYTGPNGSGQELANDFRTLRQARRWAKEYSSTE